MKEEIYGFEASDGKLISVRKWMPAGKPKAAVLLIHGMIDHSGRYAELGEALTAAGYAVWAPDHRGHGLTAQADGLWGYFAPERGFFRVLEDLHSIAKSIKETLPGLKLFIFAHSMGSFLGRGLISRWGSEFSGCVLSGTAYRNVPAGMGVVLGSLACALLGPKRPAPVLAAIGFAGYNDAFKPVRTPVDWHSKDPAANDAYMADPLCRFVCTHEFYRDLAIGLRWLERKSTMEAIPKHLPIWLFAGEKDPVGQKSGAVSRLAADYRALGLQDVALIIYPDGRHEMLHETERAPVIKAVVDWFDSK